MMVFTCPHCPTAQAYQERIKKLVDRLHAQGREAGGDQPESRRRRCGSTSSRIPISSDSFAEMQERAKQEKFNFVWLDDGPKQELSHKMGPVATPHVFIFDKARKLRFEGRIDDSERESLATKLDTRAALDALLAGKEPPVDLHARVRLLGEVGRQGGRVRQVQGALGRGAGDAREGRRRERSRRFAPTRVPASCASSTCGPRGADPASRSSTSWWSTTCASASGRSRW